MARPAPQPTRRAPGRHLLLFDGLCGLCARSVEFVVAHDRHRVFDVASLESPMGQAVTDRAGAVPGDRSTFYAVADYRGATSRPLTKARAALFVLDALGWPWKIAGLVRVLPISALDRVYDVVAKNRYRVFGRTDRCLTPRLANPTPIVDGPAAPRTGGRP
jgi:predicted DCC family thiol-disulfide oxidoreductase YuxK